MDITSAFVSYGESVEHETEVKEKVLIAVRNLEKVSYALINKLEKIHQPDGIQNLDAICKECEEGLALVPLKFAAVQEVVPSGEYYRYHYNFKATTLRLVGSTSLIIYLRENRLASHEEIAASLGLCKSREDGFHLDLEDYLIGCLTLSPELSRLAVNAVSSGDYSKPYQIRQFLRDLHSAYSLLNPKNELRKKFDELKYSLKKTEEIVYNLTLRGLKPQEGDKSG